MQQRIGYVSQVIGAVVDVCFNTDGNDGMAALPAIHEALTVNVPDDLRTNATAISCLGVLAMMPM